MDPRSRNYPINPSKGEDPPTIPRAEGKQYGEDGVHFAKTQSAYAHDTAHTDAADDLSIRLSRLESAMDRVEQHLSRILNQLPQDGHHNTSAPHRQPQMGATNSQLNTLLPLLMQAMGNSVPQGDGLSALLPMLLNQQNTQQDAQGLNALMPLLMQALGRNQ
ncbi:MAG: hypothetical protein E7328_07660 [Clostridiales bacterium]|nr:hypothetical protein [Clostridiales bacterium]